MTDFMVATLWTSRRDGSGPNGQAAVEHFARHGLTDPEAQEQIRRRAGYYPDLVPPMRARYTRLLQGGEAAIGGRPWLVSVGYGQAPALLSALSPSLATLITGGMVLPRVSTNICVFDYGPDASPQPLYLSSLDRYRHLP